MLPPEPLAARIGGSVGLQNAARTQARSEGERALAARLETDLRVSTESLIRIHDLEGRAVGEVLQRVANDVRVEAPVDAGRAGALGGVVSGALTGLGADLMAGGLTFGAGMVAGAIVGALGGAGIAQGVNVVRGKNDSVVRWEDAFLDGLVTSALLRYLAIAHYGRGRGEWKESEYPPFWRPLVVDAVIANADRLAALWSLRRDTDGAAPGSGELTDLLREMALNLLDELYPGAMTSVEAAR